jgi:hypothetical protein
MRAVRFAGLAAVLFCARTAAAGGIPAVGVVEAPGVTCPSSDGVRAALARLRGGPAVGEASFRLFIDRTAEVAHVDLCDGGGQSVLAREIPMTATDCDHAAQAIALIVERHFHALDWSPGPVTAAVAPTTPPPLPPPAAPAPPAPAPAVVPASPPAPLPVPLAPPAAEATPPPATVAATAIATAAPPDQPPLLRFDTAATLPRLALGAGPAFWSRGGIFALALDGRWRIAPASPIQIGAGVLLPPLHASAAVGGAGNVHVAAVPITASVGLTRALGRMAVGVHAGALWTIERGQSEGIPTPATAWRTVLGLGLGASAAWPLTPRLRITGQVDGFRAVLGRAYSIAGVPGTVLDPSPWQAVVVLGAELVIQP